MLPVVEPDGRSTSIRILLYSLALFPASSVPVLLGMSGKIYLAGAALLGLLFFYFAVHLALPELRVTDARSRVYARRLFRCSIVYLPLLFALMIGDATWH